MWSMVVFCVCKCTPSPHSQLLIEATAKFLGNGHSILNGSVLCMQVYSLSSLSAINRSYCQVFGEMDTVSSMVVFCVCKSVWFLCIPSSGINHSPVAKLSYTGLGY